MRRKYFIFFTVFYLFMSSNVFAQTSTNAATVVKPEPKYPQWVLDIRRADIIAFGAFPISWLLAATFVDLYRCSINDWDLRYAPWPATAAGAIPRTNEEFITIIGVAAGISVGLALADFIVVKIKRARAKAKSESLPRGDPIIIRRNLKTGDIIEEEPDENPEDSAELEIDTVEETKE
ncbi:MAG: hypothetical protein Ta2F_16980 [Termitinemataceae bacterium]|nr:MAG: hypothetical protein Ta2F_16980 [Termitinemataceae bacterium]